MEVHNTEKQSGIVVLCGGITHVDNTDGLVNADALRRIYMPNPWSAKRCEHAVDLYCQLNQTPYIIVSTRATTHTPTLLDPDGHPITESQITADYIMDLACIRGIFIPHEKILIENTSGDTIGNAYYTRILITDPFQIHDLYIITSKFHMARTQLIFDWIFNLSNILPTDSPESPDSLNDADGKSPINVGASSHQKSTSMNPRNERLKLHQIIYHHLPRPVKTARKYKLTYIAADNVGLAAEELKGRLTKETIACLNVASLRRRITNLRDLHTWIYKDHLVYSYRQMYVGGIFKNSIHPTHDTPPGY